MTSSHVQKDENDKMEANDQKEASVNNDTVDDEAQEPMEKNTSPNFTNEDDGGDVDSDETEQDTIAKLKDQLLRSMAETENLRRRSQREKEETSKYAITSFARELLSVSDNLRRALESVPEDHKKDDAVVENLMTGVEMTEKMLLDLMSQQGIRKINPLHEKFDHNFHQAMVEIPSEEHDPGIIVEVMQSGYVIHDRLLRPAMVGVAKKPS